jgi:hypothetical protein
MFFRKAIDDATSEWAQHHAKRFIDTKTKVGVWEGPSWPAAACRAAVSARGAG